MLFLHCFACVVLLIDVVLRCFRLSKFSSNAPTHSFRAYYGVDDSGDVTKTANIKNFAEQVCVAA